MPAPPEPRRHHYVPEFLLAGFTPSGSKDDFLYVHDADEPREPRRARPKTVGFERDYNRVDVGDPLWVERLFSEFEDRSAPIVREVADSWELPKEERLHELLRFVALLVVRVPRHRNWLADSADSFTRFYLKARATPEWYAAEYEKVRSSGVVANLPPEPNFETVRKLLVPGECRFEVDRTWLVGQCLKHGEGVFQQLLQRRWGLMVAVGDAPRFVCCDSPVVLGPMEPRPWAGAVGWATPRTVAVVPLTKQVVLVGFLDQRAAPCLKLHKPAEIADLNALTVMNASRWVYSPKEDFIWRRPDSGAIGHASDFRELAPARRRDPEVDASGRPDPCPSA
jgi:hypothetical protein